jgi:hypothetical protein
MNAPSQQAMDQVKNVAVITLRQVIQDGMPVSLVSHDEDDGGWQFLTLESFTTADARVVSLEEMLSHDPSLAELMDLKIGWKAFRKCVSSPWERQPKDQN